MKTLYKKIIKSKHLELEDIEVKIVEGFTLGIGKEIYLIASSSSRYLMKFYKSLRSAKTAYKNFRRSDLEKEGD